MPIRLGRIVRGIGVAAVLLLAVAGCSKAAEPVKIVYLERIPEPEGAPLPTDREHAVVYRFGVRSEDVTQLLGRNGKFDFEVFRCPAGERMWQMSVEAEATAPGARITYLRMFTARRFVDTDSWHCGRFVEPHERMFFYTDDGLSEVFRFQPEGDTSLTRDREPSTVRIPPPPPEAAG